MNKTIMTKNSFLHFNAIALTSVFVLSGCMSAPPPVTTPPTQTVVTQPAATPEADLPLPTETPYTVAEAEKLAGFDVKEPAYLPKEASFDYATYQKPPNPSVTLYYKYGNMGRFFQIVQAPQESALTDPNACGVNGDECQTLQAGSLTVKYRLTAPTESLLWSADAFTFRLLRIAGEPDKIYKDELLKVAESMK